MSIRVSLILKRRLDSKSTSCVFYAHDMTHPAEEPLKKPVNSGDPARRKNIYLPEEILEIAEEKARVQHRSLSNYLQFLVLQDERKSEKQPR